MWSSHYESPWYCVRVCCISFGFLSIAHAKMWGILLRLQLAWNKGYRKIMVESDFKDQGGYPISALLSRSSPVCAIYTCNLFCPGTLFFGHMCFKRRIRWLTGQIWPLFRRTYRVYILIMFLVFLIKFGCS